VDDPEQRLPIEAADSGPLSFFVFAQVDDPEQPPLELLISPPTQLLHLSQVDRPEQRLPLGATGFRPAQVLHLRRHHCCSPAHT